MIATTMNMNMTMTMIMIITMGIQQQSHGWVLMGGYTTVTTDWHHTRTNPYTRLASSADEHLHFSTEISKKELSQLVLVVLLVLGISYFLHSLSLTVLNSNNFVTFSRFLLAYEWLAADEFLFYATYRKTALMLALCKLLRDKYSLAAVRNIPDYLIIYFFLGIYFVRLKVSSFHGEGSVFYSFPIIKTVSQY